MMELDERYCDVIINRWQDFTGKQAVNENGTTFDMIKEDKHGKSEADADSIKDTDRK